MERQGKRSRRSPRKLLEGITRGYLSPCIVVIYRSTIFSLQVYSFLRTRVLYCRETIDEVMRVFLRRINPLLYTDT